MKLVVEFDLPKDQEKYEVFNKAQKIHKMFQDFSAYLRNQYNYQHDFECASDAIIGIKDEYLKLLQENDLGTEDFSLVYGFENVIS